MKASVLPQLFLAGALTAYGDSDESDVSEYLQLLWLVVEVLFKSLGFRVRLQQTVCLLCQHHVAVLHMGRGSCETQV